MKITGSKSKISPFDALLESVRPELGQLLAKYQIPQQDSEDLLQDALVTLVYKWETIRKRREWLLSTVKNRCIAYWARRRSDLYEAVDAAILEMLAEPQGPPQDESDLRHDLNSILNQLPPRCREVMRLRYGLGFKSREVADQLGYDSEELRRLTTRCLSALTRALTDAGFSRLHKPSR